MKVEKWLLLKNKAFFLQKWLLSPPEYLQESKSGLLTDSFHQTSSLMSTVTCPSFTSLEDFSSPKTQHEAPRIWPLQVGRRLRETSFTGAERSASFERLPSPPGSQAHVPYQCSQQVVMSFLGMVLPAGKIQGLEEPVPCECFCQLFKMTLKNWFGGMFYF